MEDQKYLTFSESEATDSLRQCLDYFFGDDDGKKRYKFSDAYMKYSKFAEEDFVTTKRLYNVLKHTELVSEKLIVRVNSITGFLYLIDRKYFDKVKRHVRLQSRSIDVDTETTDEQSKPTSPETTQSTKSSPSFVQIKAHTDQSDGTPASPKDDVSTGQFSMADTWEEMNQQVEPTTNDHSHTSIKSPAPATTDIQVPQSVTKITNLMEQDIADTMEDINETQTTHHTQELQDEMKHFITTEVHRQWTERLATMDSKIQMDLDLDLDYLFNGFGFGLGLKNSNGFGSGFGLPFQWIWIWTWIEKFRWIWIWIWIL